MKHQNKLSSEQKQQQAAAQQSQQQAAREFASAEEMLRHDAANTRVPPGIAQRLAKSAGGIPGKKRSWWQRLLGS
jgi:hypothetical protein